MTEYKRQERDESTKDESRNERERRGREDVKEGSSKGWEAGGRVGELGGVIEIPMLSHQSKLLHV